MLLVKIQSKLLLLILFNSLQNPVARWHICHGPVNDIAFSADGTYIATIGRDGIVIFHLSFQCLGSLFHFHVAPVSPSVFIWMRTNFDYRLLASL